QPRGLCGSTPPPASRESWPADGGRSAPASGGRPFVEQRLRSASAAQPRRVAASTVRQGDWLHGGARAGRLGARGGRVDVLQGPHARRAAGRTGAAAGSAGGRRRDGGR